MKFFIVGLHCNGKRDVMRSLIKDGINCGKLFTNADIVDERYDFYTDEDIRTMFESGSYIFIKDISQDSNCYEGLSFYEFDNNDVFVLTPDQLVSIPKSPLSDDICLIWMDSNMNERYRRYQDSNLSYNWKNEEEIETQALSEFIKYVYSFPNSRTLYFFNEDPQRVAAIIYAMVKHPDLVSVFEKKFK